jgi:hypothetical protein
LFFASSNGSRQQMPDDPGIVALVLAIAALVLALAELALAFAELGRLP